MANEWVKVELYGNNNDGQPVRYACADTDSFSKGQLMALVDPRVASLAVGATNIAYAGVASMDKESGDGATSISCWTQGIFEVVASGAIRAGDLIRGVSENVVASCSAGTTVIGRCLEAAADAETVNVRLNL